MEDFRNKSIEETGETLRAIIAQLSGEPVFLFGIAVMILSIVGLIVTAIVPAVPSQLVWFPYVLLVFGIVLISFSYVKVRGTLSKGTAMDNDQNASTQVSTGTSNNQINIAIQKLKTLEFELSAFDLKKMVYESQQNSRNPGTTQNPHLVFVKPVFEDLLDEKVREYLPEDVRQEIDAIINRPKYTINEVLIQITKIMDYLQKSN